MKILTTTASTHRILTLAALCAVASASCFGATAKEEHFYFLSGPSKTAFKVGGPRLGVADLTVAPGYSSERLAYRLGDNHLRYYVYRQWVAEPGRMLTDMAIRQLRNSGLYAEVAPAERVRAPHGILEGHVLAIEEVDEAENEQWKARLAIAFTLRSERSEKVLLRHIFDTTRPCAKRDPADVARLVSKVFASEMQRLGRRIARKLASLSERQKKDPNADKAD